MEEQRYQVDVVYDGADGLDYGLSNAYDLILLDIMLPKLDGFQVARQLRSSPHFHPHSDADTLDRVFDKISGLDCGADDYMTKPFDSGELLARVRALTPPPGRGAGRCAHPWAISPWDCGSRSLKRPGAFRPAGLQGVRGNASASDPPGRGGGQRDLDRQGVGH